MLNYSDPSVFSYESTCFTIMINSAITFLALALTLMHIGESTTTGDPLFTHHITYRVTSITYITSLHTCITVTSHVSHTSLITYMYHCHMYHIHHSSHIFINVTFITYITIICITYTIHHIQIHVFFVVEHCEQLWNKERYTSGLVNDVCKAIAYKQ